MPTPKYTIEPWDDVRTVALKLGMGPGPFGPSAMLRITEAMRAAGAPGVDIGPSRDDRPRADDDPAVVDVRAMADAARAAYDAVNAEYQSAVLATHRARGAATPPDAYSMTTMEPLAASPTRVRALADCEAVEDDARQRRELARVAAEKATGAYTDAHRSASARALAANMPPPPLPDEDSGETVRRGRSAENKQTVRYGRQSVIR